MWIGRIERGVRHESQKPVEGLKAKARACKTAEDLAELAEDQGVELSDDQLEAISGGFGDACHTNCDKSQDNQLALSS